MSAATPAPVRSAALPLTHSQMNLEVDQDEMGRNVGILVETHQKGFFF